MTHRPASPTLGRGRGDPWNIGLTGIATFNICSPPPPARSKRGNSCALRSREATAPHTCGSARIGKGRFRGWTRRPPKRPDVSSVEQRIDVGRTSVLVSDKPFGKFAGALAASALTAGTVLRLIGEESAPDSSSFASFRPSVHKKFSQAGKVSNACSAESAVGIRVVTCIRSL